MGHPVLPGDGGVGRRGCADEGQDSDGRNVDGCRCKVRVWDSSGGPCGIMELFVERRRGGDEDRLAENGANKGRIGCNARCLPRPTLLLLGS